MASILAEALFKNGIFKAIAASGADISMVLLCYHPKCSTWPRRRFFRVLLHSEGCAAA